MKRLALLFSPWSNEENSLTLDKNNLFALSSWKSPSSVVSICPRPALPGPWRHAANISPVVWSRSPLPLRHPTSTQTMGLQSLITLATCLTCLATGSAAYREEALQKWSPQYFQYRFFPPQTTFKRRMPSYVQVNFTFWGIDLITKTRKKEFRLDLLKIKVTC